MAWGWALRTMFWWVYVVLILNVGSASAQNTSMAATTAAGEVQALNSVLQQWGKAADRTAWNTTGDPCSGLAIDDSTIIDDKRYNPFIKCDCSYDSNTTCHITALKVYAIDAVGVMSDELWNLVYLTNLRLGQNYLTGPISSGIGNLTRLMYLDLGTNAFYGTLPKELGRLTDLRSIGLGPNNFSGSLPSEIGNLTRLEQLYISSTGITGVIPSTFAKLENLVTLVASDVELSGQIPEFIGNWTKLQTLRLQGNAFVGPIPSALSNLTSLADLRIIGLLNSSSSLDFITDLQSLNILILKNNNITGPIPNIIGQLQGLVQLDLSFNSITGQIPGSLFSIGSLSYLFLGSNKLNGSLPTQKSASLANIDVSYNQLSGSLPSWVSEPNLQLNLIANNFLIKGSISRALPSGLKCMLNGFPCNSGLGRYSDFAIKCGGPQMKSSNQVVYESDGEDLGPASYFVSDAEKWAVSSVGLFSSNHNVSYTFNSPRQFTSLDSELFQTARMSAGSLRYYGLGLQNGNYSVHLRFAEIQFENGKTWKSLGRRIFDIYIQGNRVEKDFNIRDEASGQSYKPVEKNYTARVTANLLEIHLFWAGKGTCCIPRQGTYGPLISAVSIKPLFQPRTVSSGGDSRRTAVIIGIIVPVVTIALFSLAALWYVKTKKRAHETEDVLLGVDAKPHIFSYAELKSATGDFNPSNKLGQGGFGPVYKGSLDDGRLVAVKQLSIATDRGKDQFVTEIATISTVQHRNLVKLYGCCIDDENLMLVYEYLENKSLDKALFGENKGLNWVQRFGICVGVARGLAYLHEELQHRIVHRDVKAGNILLDANLDPKISDFGLAKLFDDKITHVSTGVAGTIGYLAPEYAIRGHLTDKVDVFGFGVVALEIVSGRSNYDARLEKDKMYLLEWAWELHEKELDMELVDERLVEFDKEEVERVIGVALLCTQTTPAQRPPMSRVLAMLAGDIQVKPVTSKPTYLVDWSFDDTSFLSSNTTSPLKFPSSSTS